MTPKAPPAPARRGRGRPPRLSRDRILDAAVALVHEDPAQPLTIRRVAKAVDSATMALYRYFPDRDALLHAVADRVTSDVAFPRLPDAAWQDELRRWMSTHLETVRPHLQLMPYLASTRRSAWLPTFLLLTEILRPLALGDEDLATAIALISTTIVGLATLATQEAAAREDLPLLRNALVQASPDEHDRVGTTLDHLLRGARDLHATVISHTIHTIEAMAAASPPDCR